MKRYIYILLMGIFSWVNGQDFDSATLKNIKGKVVNAQQQGLENVAIYDPTGVKLTTTNTEGTFAFNYTIFLKAKTQPTFRFVKEGFLPYLHNYNYNEKYLIISLGEKEKPKPVVAVVEEVKKEEKIEVKNTPKAEKKEVQKTEKPIVKIEEHTQKLTESLNTLNEDKVSKQEIQNLKKYIEYLEATLLVHHISFSEDTSIQKSEIQKQLVILKTKVEEKELEIQQVEKQKKNLIYSILGIIFLLIPSILAIVFYRNNKKTQKLNVVLEEQLEQIKNQNEEISTQRDNIIAQNHQIEEAYTNIHASILYAKKIQESILIKPEGITQYFKDAFIFYQPKDIVSGDFYWFSSIENKLIIAAVDCTGHGVPGAFMTMMGNTILNEIVNERGLTNPAEILTELNIKIHNTLKQENKENANDGMDMALVCIDSKKQELIFAGANNPLYYISDNQIQEIRATRSGIGGEVEKTFENHTLSLKTVDSFYLFSDGFQDQFGEESNKKYMKKRFREFLHEISKQPFSTQQQLIEQELQSWKGNLIQTDDIVVIGVKPL